MASLFQSYSQRWRSARQLLKAAFHIMAHGSTTGATEYTFKVPLKGEYKTVIATDGTWRVVRRGVATPE